MTNNDWLRDPILRPTTSPITKPIAYIDDIPVRSSDDCIIPFAETVKRIKEFRHTHCGCDPDEDFSPGFLAQMAYCFGFTVELNLKKKDTDETTD